MSGPESGAMSGGFYRELAQGVPAGASRLLALCRAVGLGCFETCVQKGGCQLRGETGF